jgi:hypothetical protein
VPEIVSASRRTDLPAFHARWFVNRVREGFCHWVHPYTGQVRRVSLRPDDVRAIVFWTRHPGPLRPYLDELQALGRPLLFQFTITGQGPPVEAHNPPVATALRQFEALARRLGPDAVLWRYDPILFEDGRAAGTHRRRFAALAARLEGMTRRCTISFVDFYGKTERNLAPLEKARGAPYLRPGVEDKRRLAAELGALGAERGMEVLSCCDDSLVGEGVGKSRCVDPEAIGRVAGAPLPPIEARPTRKDCGCVRSVDVGTYDTCAFGCAYCYAVGHPRTARRRIAECDPEDSLLWRPPSLEGVRLEEREKAGS